MFVRWKKRKLSEIKRRGWLRREATTLLTAVLVKSMRVDGKPRQKHVKTLASIQERWLGMPGHRFGFWRKVAESLDTLELSGKARRAIEQKLAETVPATSKRDIRQARAKVEAKLG